MGIERNIYSDLPIPPGEYLAEVLKEKGINQAEIAQRMGRPPQAINEIIAGRKAVTPDTALQLERALGVPAHIWTSLEARFQLIKARQLEMQQLREESPLLNEIPYKILCQMGFVKKTRNIVDKIRELHSFFGVSALSNLKEVRAYDSAFRCARRRNASPYALIAWLICAEKSAQQTSTQSYDKGLLFSCVPRLRELTQETPPVFEPKLKELLANCGIALVLMPHFPKTYAYGAAGWLSQDKAFIIMSFRGSWADIFWFSLFHELAHIYLHKSSQLYIDDGTVNPEIQAKEEEADRFAANKLIPQIDYQEFVNSSSFTIESIQHLARQIGIAPGIVVGRLQHDRHLRQDSLLNALRERYKWK